jgi:hypothetical protein
MSYTTSTQYNIKDLLQLQKHIKQSTTRLNDIVISLSFNSGNLQLSVELSEEFDEQDITDFENALASYINPDFITLHEHINLVGSTNSVKNTDYTLLHAWQENGQRNIYSVVVNSCLKPSNTDDLSNPNFNYDIRIYDSTNNILLAENTYSNTIPTDNELLISNVYESTLEVHIKSNLLNCSVNISKIYIKI